MPIYIIIIYNLSSLRLAWEMTNPATPLPPPFPTLQPPTLSLTATPFQHQGILIDLPENASQLQYGAEVYRLICSTCHADDGSGLTDEWRSTWAPEDQNCWQSKCHGFNHPPDGFYLPHSPPVVGELPRSLFANALELYRYIRSAMPWHDPGSLTEKEAWSVTAYVLLLNGIDPGPQLDAERAASISLRSPTTTGPPSPTPPTPMPTSISSPTPMQAASSTPGRPSTSSLPLLIALALALAGITLFFMRRQK